MNELAKQIEALLFVSGEGMSKHALATQCKKNDAEIATALSELKEHLRQHHALDILEHENRASLVTAPSVAKLVESFAEEEFTGELTRAALETLAVVAYNGPVRRSEIDYIRGVNSSFMLRNLLLRGLVERSRDPKDARSFSYRITPQFLKFLGLTSQSDLPQFGSFTASLEEFLKNSN
ncbi:MAG TPA: SMC-Scp complex subunit ScpB [Candidatus Paceibacterota bacterium]